MSIRISGMRMPESCKTCPFALLTHYGERECYGTEEDVTDLINDRHDKCPMEEVDD